MLRTILTIGLFVMLGLFALNLVFSLFGPLFTLLFWLLGIAFRIAVVGLIAYFILRVVSPNTARNLRERWSGTRV